MKIISRKIILILIIFLLILIAMTTIIKAENEEFTLTDTTLSIKLNSSKYLAYENKPTGSNITWESSNPSVATVDTNGKVNAISIGTSTITATVDEHAVTCKVTVVYDSLKIGANSGNSVSEVNLVIGEHGSENLKIAVYDGHYEEVTNADVKWSSSNTGIVTVDSNGKITGISAGTVTITATAGGVSDTCKVNVSKAPEYTDFSNAKYELLFDTDVDLKITGIKPNEDSNNNYYYVITATNKKPEIPISNYGGVELVENSDIKFLNVNADENYVYARKLDKFVELNQELYLWILQDIRLDNAYYTENQKYISHATKFIVESQKLNRPQLPQLNLILKSFNIGSYQASEGAENFTYINFRFPSATENRKFKIKIGKVTDNSILTKIQKNDYSGITGLLSYAKKNTPIYSAELETTDENYYKNEQTLFDGNKLLKNKEYYYIYVEFDNENGKYYPIEGVTLGQAWLSNSTKGWDLWAYTADNFEWNDLSSTNKTNNTVDNTISQTVLPNAGVTQILSISILVLIVCVIFLKVKKDEYKEIR